MFFWQNSLSSKIFCVKLTKKLLVYSLKFTGSKFVVKCKEYIKKQIAKFARIIKIGFLVKTMQPTLKEDNAFGSSLTPLRV